MEEKWNSVLTLKIKKKKNVKSDPNSPGSPTVPQTKFTTGLLTGPAVSCFPDHEPKINLENMKDVEISARSGKPAASVGQEEDLSNLVDLQQDTIARLQQEMYDMSSSMAEKDKMVTNLQSQLTEMSRNHELQLEQLVWLNSVANDHEDITKRQEKVIRVLRESLDVDETSIFNKDLEITALESTLSAKSALCEEQAGTIQSMQAKFLAMYDHCSKLARDRENKMDYITTLLLSEEKAKQISAQQEQLTKSLHALAEKTRKTKFIDGNQSFYCELTDPSPMVRQEIDAARSRIQKQDIVKLAGIVDELAAHYGPDRYENISTIIEFSEPRSGPGKMFSWVHSEMLAVWVHAVDDVTPEEEEMFDKFLQKQLRPEPVHSPPLQKPNVNWMRLNTNMHRNLPKPSRFPVLGCALDPAVYKATYICYGEIVHRFDEGVEPFGAVHGFLTDMGIVPLPDVPLHGYKYCVERDQWVIAASGG